MKIMKRKKQNKWDIGTKSGNGTGWI